ncbi:MAG: biosynthetic-type acetolactate synthase large subunit [Eubacteriales bacterium]|nr:biosynthetic-type acetolactate synthase large subunit [Eubacteriales bacterium]
MNGAEVIVKFLQDKGVKHAFGYPGGPVLVLYDAIYNAGFPHVQVRHEQGAIHAAEGYAKVTGVPGVVIATSGPGATNLVTGIADAMLDSVPVLCVTGAVARKATGTDAFQEADITGITQPITKYNYLVMTPEDLLPILEEAWALTTEGRPGPVLVNVPKDLLAIQIDTTAEARSISSYTRHRPAKVQTGAMTEKVYAALAKSKKPLLLAGGGCVISKGGVDDMTEFIRCLGIPVATTLMGKGAVSDDHSKYLGHIGMHGTPQANTALGTCDLLLAVGCRFSDRIIGDPDKYNLDTDRVIIHVDIDSAEIGKNVRADIAIEDDAADFFRTMAANYPTDRTCGVYSEDWLDWIDSLLAKKKRYDELVEAMYVPTYPLLPQYLIHRVAQANKGKNPIVVTDVGQHQMFATQHFPVESPRSWITSGGLGTMGFGLPAAIGASFADHSRPTILFVGDGGFQMTFQELGVLANLKLPVKVFIMDNGSLGMVRQWQELFYDRRFSQSGMEGTPDFNMIAKAYNLPCGFANDEASLAREIAKSVETDGPYIVHCIVDTGANVYPMIPAGRMPNELIMPGMD